jgi:predicted transcriptional regulator
LRERILDELRAHGPLHCEHVAEAIHESRQAVYLALRDMLGDTVALVDLGRYDVLGSRAQHVYERKRGKPIQRDV